MGKIYESLIYTTDMVLLSRKDKEQIRCDFTNGVTAPAFEGGRYYAPNKHVGKLLEEHPDYGTRFKLVEGQDDVEEDEEEEEEVEDTAESSDVGNNEPTEVSDILTKEQAKAFLRQRVEGIKEREMMTKEAIRAVAEKHGYVFVDF